MTKYLFQWVKYAPLMSEWINKIWYKMGNHLALKRKEILSPATIHVYPEDIMLNEIKIDTKIQILSNSTYVWYLT
jgi:hypothetical protein